MNYHYLVAIFWLKRKKTKTLPESRGYLTCGTGGKTQRRSSPLFPASWICVCTYRRFVSDLNSYPESTGHRHHQLPPDLVPSCVLSLSLLRWVFIGLSLLRRCFFLSDF
ncbi:hypothetical protein Hanom_Chr06g00573901 [Helianthus anomalus]